MKTTMMKRNAAKRTLTVLLNLLLILALNAASVFAASGPVIEDADYEGGGRVEVEFTGKVTWKSPAVTVKDLSGKSYTAVIVEKDNDEIEFKIKNYKKNTTYKYTIKGAARKGSVAYTRVSGKVKIPAAGKIAIDEIEFDQKDKEVEFEFKPNVQWSNPKVTITDNAGRNYVTKIDSKDKDSIEVKVKGVKKGKTYNYKVSGIRKYGTKDYITLSGRFKAVGE